MAPRCWTGFIVAVLHYLAGAIYLVFPRVCVKTLSEQLKTILQLCLLTCFLQVLVLVDLSLEVAIDRMSEIITLIVALVLFGLLLQSMIILEVHVDRTDSTNVQRIQLLLRRFTRIWRKTSIFGTPMAMLPDDGNVKRSC